MFGKKLIKVCVSNETIIKSYKKRFLSHTGQKKFDSLKKLFETPEKTNKMQFRFLRIEKKYPKTVYRFYKFSATSNTFLFVKINHFRMQISFSTLQIEYSGLNTLLNPSISELYKHGIHLPQTLYITTPVRVRQAQ